MHPILFKMGNLVIHTYGFFIALAFLAAIFISKREACLVGEDPEKVTDLIFWGLAAGILGSRLFYVVINWRSYFPSDPLGVFKVWEGGLVFYGGFALALPVVLFYLRKHKMPVWKTCDMLTPALPFGHFLGRLGCLSAGCCYGATCDLPWAVTFTDPGSLAPLGVSLHPTQLYSAVGNLAIFLVVMLIKRYKRFEGQLFWTYAIIYAVFRSVVEAFRGDFRGGFLFDIFSVSQTIALIMALMGGMMLFYLFRRSEKKSLAEAQSTQRAKNGKTF